MNGCRTILYTLIISNQVVAPLIVIRLVITSLILRLTVISLAILMPPLPASAQPPTTNNAMTRDVLTFIRSLEAPGGYDDVERRIKSPPPKRPSAMTLGEVLKWQKQVRGTGAPSTAMGGYQIVHDTLADLIRIHKLDKNALFDVKMQDRLAKLLMAECGNIKSENLNRYANCLARIWAALPLTSGPNKGLSAYHGIAGNRALTTPQTVLALLAGKPVAIGASAKTIPIPNASESTDVESADESADSIPTLRDINAAMRGAMITGKLTPSVQKWSFDPYAVE